jgi:hypothetical protein
MTARKSNPPRGPITAAQVVADMKNDRDYQRRRDELDKSRAAAVVRHLAICAPILRELSDNGFVYDSLDDLRKSRRKYGGAVPVLIKWLEEVDDYDAKESIVRALTVPWAKPQAGPVLISEFRRISDDAAEGQSLKWAIANALAVVADETVVDDLIELVTDMRHGKSREMIAVALGNMKDRRIADVLVGLLQDEQMAGHAIIGLGKLRSRGTRSAIEPFLNHHKSWIRAEAKKSVERIDQGTIQGTRVQ